jgi:aspartate/glutamate racemase
MSKDISNKKLGVIHVATFVAQTVQKYIEEIIPEVNVVHFADDTIQQTNLAAGPGVIPPYNFYKFTTYAQILEQEKADLIMLSCSTFNQAVEYAQPMISTPLLQIDRPMMDLAVRDGKRIGLLATLPTTVPSSERLLRKAAAEAGKEIEVRTILCSEAFKVLMQGNKAKHNEMLLEEADKLSKEVDAIVLAQASMCALESDLKNARVPVYNSPRTGFTRAREILEAL